MESLDQETRLAFKEVFLRLLLPIIIRIREQRSISGVTGRVRAVKFAIKKSFALTARRINGVVNTRAFEQVSVRKRRAAWGRVLKNGRYSQRLFPWRRIYMQSLRRSCFRLRSTASYCPKSQVSTLRMIIPGGGAMDVAKLLKETIYYILALQIQVEALETLTEAVQD